MCRLAVGKLGIGKFEALRRDEARDVEDVRI